MRIKNAKIYNKFNAMKKNLKILQNESYAVFAKKKAKSENFALKWGRVDSNHRTDSRTDLQSVAIATMRLPHKK